MRPGTLWPTCLRWPRGCPAPHPRHGLMPRAGVSAAEPADSLDVHTVRGWSHLSLGLAWEEHTEQRWGAWSRSPGPRGVLGHRPSRTSPRTVPGRKGPGIGHLVVDTCAELTVGRGASHPVHLLGESETNWTKSPVALPLRPARAPASCSSLGRQTVGDWDPGSQKHRAAQQGEERGGSKREEREGGRQERKEGKVREGEDRLARSDSPRHLGSTPERPWEGAGAIT